MTKRELINSDVSAALLQSHHVEKSANNAVNTNIGLSYEDVLNEDFQFDMDAHDVMVFLHIQKTGGTSFGKHLVRDLDLKVTSWAFPKTIEYLQLCSFTDFRDPANVSENGNVATASEHIGTRIGCSHDIPRDGNVAYTQTGQNWLAASIKSWIRMRVKPQSDGIFT